MGFQINKGSAPIIRRNFLRQSSLAALAIAGGLPIVSWAVRGNQLHIRNYTDIVTLDPPFMVSGAEAVVSKAMFQCLVQFQRNGTWDVKPDAAEYFKQVDATHYDFRLKPRQMFSNGFGEMTADDVKFSYERMIDPNWHALNSVDMGPLSHVQVHDRYSGTIVLHSPYAAFIPIAVAGSSGAIMSRKALESVGGRFGIEPPSSSGPYLFRQWQAKRKTVLERNPQWKGSDAAFDEIHVYSMTDNKAAEMAFEAGQLNCAQISVESTDSFRKKMPPNSHLEVYPSGRNYWLGMNQENPSLQDIRVRQAIQWGIDVNAVVEAAWFGLAAPAMGPIPRGMLGYRQKTLVPTQGDPDKARALLKEAGVELPLRLRLDVNNDSLELTAVQVMQWSLKKVGIEISIHAQDNGSFLNIGSEEAGDQWQDIQLFFQSFVGGGDPYYAMVWWIKEQLGVWNWERFSNDEFDRLNHEALATTNEAERERMYHRMQDLLEESGSFRFITNGVMPQITRNTIKPSFLPDGYPILRGFRPVEQSA